METSIHKKGCFCGQDCTKQAERAHWRRSRSLLCASDAELVPFFNDFSTSYLQNLQPGFSIDQTTLLTRGTVAGIYDLRRLQIKRCGRLGPRAVLALDCCPSILLFVQVTQLRSFRRVKMGRSQWRPAL